MIPICSTPTTDDWRDKFAFAKWKQFTLVFGHVSKIGTENEMRNQEKNSPSIFRGMKLSGSVMVSLSASSAEGVIVVVGSGLGIIAETDCCVFMKVVLVVGMWFVKLVAAGIGKRTLIDIM